MMTSARALTSGSPPPTLAARRYGRLRVRLPPGEPTGHERLESDNRGLGAYARLSGRGGSAREVAAKDGESGASASVALREEALCLIGRRVATLRRQGRIDLFRQAGRFPSLGATSRALAEIVDLFRSDGDPEKLAMAVGRREARPLEITRQNAPPSATI